MYHFEIHTVLYILYVLSTYFTRSKKQEGEAIVIRFDPFSECAIVLLCLCHQLFWFAATKLMRIFSTVALYTVLPLSQYINKHIIFFKSGLRNWHWDVYKLYIESGFDNYLITLSWREPKIILFSKQTLNRRLWSVSLLIKKIYKISGDANADLRVVSQRLKEPVYKTLKNNAVNIIKQTQFMHERWKINVFFYWPTVHNNIHMMALCVYISWI